MRAGSPPDVRASEISSPIPTFQFNHRIGTTSHQSRTAALGVIGLSVEEVEQLVEMTDPVPDAGGSDAGAVDENSTHT